MKFCTWGRTTPFINTSLKTVSCKWPGGQQGEYEQMVGLTMNTVTMPWAVLGGVWAAEWWKFLPLFAQDCGGYTSNTMPSCGPLNPKLMWGNQKGPVEGELDDQKPTVYVLLR